MFMRRAFGRGAAVKNVFCPPAAIYQVCDEKPQLSTPLLSHSLASWATRSCTPKVGEYKYLGKRPRSTSISDSDLCLWVFAPLQSLGLGWM